MNYGPNLSSLSLDNAGFAQVAGCVAGLRQRFCGMYWDDTAVAPLVRPWRWTHISRVLFPGLIADYRIILLDKKLLQAKLHEFCRQNTPEGEEA